MRYVQSKCYVLKDQMERGDYDDKSLKNSLKKIIQTHNDAIEMCTQLEDILNLLMLVWYSVFTIVLCFLFFEFNIVGNLFIIRIF